MTTSGSGDNKDVRLDAADNDGTGGLLSLLLLEKRPRLRALALVGTVAATVFLMWRSDEPPKTDNEAAQLRGQAEPDGFVVNGHYTSYDEAGNVKVRFTSPRIEQFEQDNLATMEAPRARIFGEPGTEPWTVEADKGNLMQDTNLLHLMDNVRVVRTLGGSKATLTTSTLTLDSGRGIAYTDAPVEIRDKMGVTRAIGMKAQIDERILELNSQVEGRYETGN